MIIMPGLLVRRLLCCDLEGLSGWLVDFDLNFKVFGWEEIIIY